MLIFLHPFYHNDLPMGGLPENIDLLEKRCSLENGDRGRRSLSAIFPEGPTPGMQTI